MNYYDNIKSLLMDNEINKRIKNYSINKNDLDTYYKVGKMLSDAGKHYGEGIIKKYSIKLTMDVDKKYNQTNLKRMRQFYNLIEKGAPLAHQLSWSHYVELLPIKDNNRFNYYLNITIRNNLSRNELRNRIKSQEYERLPEETKNKLKDNKNINLADIVKEPIIINNNCPYEVVSEKILQRMILEKIESFMKELGNSFSFIGSEYKIKIGPNYNYIDLLLFNYEYNCFVVIELKVTELKKEHIGQIQVYMNYIDNNLKKTYHDKTVGIILVRSNNEFIMSYCSYDRIIAKEYVLK